MVDELFVGRQRWVIWSQFFMTDCWDNGGKNAYGLFETISSGLEDGDKVLDKRDFGKQWRILIESKLKRWEEFQK